MYSSVIQFCMQVKFISCRLISFIFYTWRERERERMAIQSGQTRSTPYKWAVEGRKICGELTATAEGCAFMALPSPFQDPNLEQGACPSRAIHAPHSLSPCHPYEVNGITTICGHSTAANASFCI